MIITIIITNDNNNDNVNDNESELISHLDLELFVIFKVKSIHPPTELSYHEIIGIAILFVIFY